MRHPTQSTLPSVSNGASPFDFSELASLVESTTPPRTYPHASCVTNEVVIYDALEIGNGEAHDSVLAELGDVLENGPGVFVVRNAVPLGILDPVTEAFERLIAQQRASGQAAGDHFAAAGVNDRVWNALEKLALADPELFVDYYACDALRWASLAWLGPHYQVTSQINVVNPGGQAQSPHCDYHLGFMSSEQATRFPPRVHAMSRMLTLQGAIAHCDMPVETGPTKLLPHSQKYQAGYRFSTKPEVAQLFEDRHIQIPLRAGDAMFFNPALIHAAGTNTTTTVRRMANLLQVSSAFGRAMESVDRRAMCESIFPILSARINAGWTFSQVETVLAATAEGYAFPTNLDRDPPIGGLAPPSQADVMRLALEERLDVAAFAERLEAHDLRRQTTG